VVGALLVAKHSRPLAGASLNLEPENKDGRSQRGCR